jgi:hypothetical protein
MGEILNLERSDCSRIGNIILRPLVCCEPAEKSAFKLITLDSPHHGMARMRDKPKKNVIWRSSRYEHGDAGQTGQNQIRQDCKKDFAKNMSFLSRWVRVCRRLHRFGQINPYPGDGRRRSKLQPARAEF